VQRRFKAQARRRLEAGHEVLEAGAVRALDVAGDLAAGAGRDHAPPRQPDQLLAAQAAQRRVDQGGVEVRQLSEVVAMDGRERARQRAEDAGVLDGEPVLVQAQGGVLGGAVEQVLEHLGEIGGQAGGPVLRGAIGDGRRHGSHHTGRT
jgi:hypothetical protein